MHTDVARVAAGKRLLLLSKFMRESGFPNADEVTHKIASGFDVVGALSSSEAAVTKTTEDEVANGWLTGPCTEKRLSDKLGLWVPVPRFGVKQGGT